MYLLKKTLGKDDKYYYYESLSEVDDPATVYWYKIDKSYFEFLINKNKADAIKTEYNEKGEITYLEYNRKSVEHVKDKSNTGCAKSILSILLFIISLFIIYN